MPFVGRYDDIYASLIVQRVMLDRGFHVHFGAPFVFQQRNDHDLLQDLRAEIDGMGNTVKLAEWLDMLDLPGKSVVEKTIADMGLDLEMIFNRDSLMILPRGVNKALGFKAAIAELGVPANAVVGVGDAENDDVFLRLCGVYAAVANAIPSIRAAMLTPSP